MSGRVCVIGAGSSGVCAVKCLLEAGFTDVTCYERRNVIGGLWYYNAKPATWPDEACVNRSTVINTSKEFMCYSDYPMPDDCPNFCHNDDVKAYFDDYSKHFGVDKHIQFDHEVMMVKKHSTYESTGQWEVKVKDHKTAQEKTEVFDFVLVANGHHGKPNLPHFPGQENFKGKTMHSREFKEIKGIEGKKALVVGIGNSGGDVSVDISKYLRVILSTRRGAWVMNRLLNGGMPWDYLFHNRWMWIKQKWLLPQSYRPNAMKKMINGRFNHDLYHMTPLNNPDATHPTVNDEFPNRVACGMITVKPNVRNFTQTGVVFEDGSEEDNIDLVVFATGYYIGFPFVDKNVLDVRENKVNMYKNMWIPELPKQTIAFLGVFQPLGAIFPLVELQSRLAARVFKGEVTLPSRKVMQADIDAYMASMRGRYVDTVRHTIQRDWLPFMDELAELVGCKPNLMKLLFTDPSLFNKVLFGPGVPYHYRLHGPNAWPGARKAIFTVLDRIQKPFDTRTLPKHNHNKKSSALRNTLLASLLVGSLAYGVYYANHNGVDLTKYVPWR